MNDEPENLSGAFDALADEFEAREIDAANDELNQLWSMSNESL